MIDLVAYLEPPLRIESTPMDYSNEKEFLTWRNNVVIPKITRMLSYEATLEAMKRGVKELSNG